MKVSNKVSVVFLWTKSCKAFNYFINTSLLLHINRPWYCTYTSLYSYLSTAVCCLFRHVIVSVWRGTMFHFLWHTVSITLSWDVRGHPVGQVCRVVAVTPASAGQLVVVLVMDSCGSAVLLHGRLNYSLFFHKVKNKMDLFSKCSSWTNVISDLVCGEKYGWVVNQLLFC